MPEPETSTLQRGISVIIPVYNSSGLLELVVDPVIESLRSTGHPHEIIMVNDGSRDDSWSRIKLLISRYSCARGINFMRNYGQHNAVLCGIRLAHFETCITMDDDGQHPPQHIIPLLEKLDEGYDVVYGTPLKEQHGILRDAASKITKAVLQHAMGAETAANVSALRIFRTRLRDAFANYNGPFVSIDVLLTWGTSRFTFMPLEHLPRAGGASNYTLRKLLTHALNMMTGFTALPLQFAIWIGFFFTLFGILVLAFVVGRYLFHGEVVPGFAFLASIVAIFSGAQLFSLGIFGEYLARMHFRVMEKPSYSVGEKCSGAQI